MRLCFCGGNIPVSHFAGEGAAFDDETGVRVISVLRLAKFDFAVNQAVAFDGDADRRIAGVIAHVESVIARFGCDCAVFYDGGAVVVRERVRVGALQIRAVELHVFEREIGIILHEYFCDGRSDCAVCKRDGRVFEQLESLRFGARRADELPVNFVGVPAEIKRKVFARRDFNAVALRVFEQRDCPAVLNGVDGLLKCRVRNATDLGDRVGVAETLKVESESFHEIYPPLRNRVNKISGVVNRKCFAGITTLKKFITRIAFANILQVGGEFVNETTTIKKLNFAEQFLNHGCKRRQLKLDGTRQNRIQCLTLSKGA